MMATITPIKKKMAMLEQKAILDIPIFTMYIHVPESYLQVIETLHHDVGCALEVTANELIVIFQCFIL
jgi:UDP-N-acetylmuramyl tripeptide synthase